MIATLDTLTDAAINRLFLDPTITEIRTPRQPVRLRINKARTKASWFIVTYQRGHAKWRKAGTYPALTVKAMLSALPALLAQLQTAPDKAPIAQHEYATINDVCRWHQDRTARDRSLTPDRKANIKSAIKHQIEPTLGAVSITDITPALLDQAFFMPLQERYQISTIDAAWRILKAMIRKAHGLNLIAANPLAGLRFPDFLPGKIAPKGSKLNVTQVRDVYHTLSALYAPEYLLALLMLLHGTRIGETRKAKWEHFDFSAGYWSIPAEDTKTKTAHRLPLTDTVKDLLINYGYNPSRRGYIFYSIDPRHAIDRQAANALIQAASKRKWTSHDLRKMARSTWADLGTDYMVGEFLINHTMTKLDRTYIHTHADRLMREALENYHKHLRNGL